MNKEYKIKNSCVCGHYIAFEKQEWEKGQKPDYVIKVMGFYSGFWDRLREAISLICNSDCFYDEICIDKEELKHIKEICDELLK